VALLRGGRRPPDGRAEVACVAVLPELVQLTEGILRDPESRAVLELLRARGLTVE
jgi:hypothetical protein